MTLSSIAEAWCPGFLRPHYQRLQASPLGMRLARGIGWSAAGAIAGRGLGVVSAVAVARMLGKAGYGELGIIQSTIGMFGVFAGFGLGQTATRYVAHLRSSNPERAGRILALSTGMAVITGGLAAAALMLAAPWLAAHTLAAPKLAGLLRVGAIYLLFMALNGAQAGALSGFEAFKAIATRTLIAGIATLPLMVGGAYWAGVTGAVWGLVGGQAINCVLNQVALRAETRRAAVPVLFRGAMQELPVVWQFSVPALLAGAMVGPVNWACAAMLVNQPNGYAEMGVYNAAYSWLMAVCFLPGIASEAMLPVLAERVASRDAPRLNRAFREALRCSIVVTGLLVACVIVAAPAIMKAYGHTYVRYWPVLAVLVASGLFASIIAPTVQFLRARGTAWLELATKVGWAVVFMGAARYLVQEGAMGLATAYTAAYGVQAALAFAVTGMRPNGRARRRPSWSGRS